MAPDVLAHGQQVASLVEKRRRVKPARRCKDALPLAHSFGQIVDQARSNAQAVVERHNAEVAQGVDLRTPADAARAAGHEVALEPRNVDLFGRARQLDVDDIVALLAIDRRIDAIIHRNEVLAPANDRLAVDKAGRQLEVVSRRAHGNRQRIRRSAGNKADL